MDYGDYYWGYYTDYYRDPFQQNGVLVTLGIKTAQKPYIVWSLGPKALIYESLAS